MNCRAVERWLDRGMPEDERESVMRHVAICGACFEAFEAASSLEAVLRAGAVTARTVPDAAVAPPSPDFVANVIARVTAADSLARGARLERRRVRTWLALATDPVIVLTITSALLVAVWTLWHPNWLLDAGMSLVARWWWPAAALAPRGQVDVDPLVWIGLAVSLSPLVLWGSWALYRRTERALLLLAARPSV